MSAFDQLQPWAFDNIKFPVQSYDVSCKLRDHVHVYPHSPGGAVEKLGRELYTIKARATFQTRFPKFGDNLWPGDMADLRDRFEGGITSDLLIPTIGTIKAYIVNWTQSGSGKVRSGEFAEIEFREDQDQAFLINQLINVKVTNLTDASTALVSTANDAGVNVGSIADAINSVSGIADQVQAYGSLYTDKLQGIADACSAFESSSPELKKPKNFKVLYALHDVQLAAITTKQDVLKRSVPIVTFTTPAAMAVLDISKRMYGDASRGAEILQLNAFDDPFFIPANTNVRVYAA